MVRDLGSAEVDQRVRRPRALWPLVVAMGWLCAGGFAGGIPMMRDPSGATLQIDPAWLDRTPVDDYFLPGVFVLTVFGFGVLALLVGLVWHVSPGPLPRLDRRTGHHWAWNGTIAVGAVLVGWIGYEYAVLPETIWLMPTLIAVGLLMIGIPMLPTMRRAYVMPHR